MAKKLTGNYNLIDKDDPTRKWKIVMKDGQIVKMTDKPEGDKPKEV